VAASAPSSAKGIVRATIVDSQVIAFPPCFISLANGVANAAAGLAVIIG
jgi:hypothetical protein